MLSKRTPLAGMKARTALLALLAALAFAPAAQARGHLGRHQVRVRTGPWPELVRVARDYWAARGRVDTCRRVRVWVVLAGESEVAHAPIGSRRHSRCDIAFNRLFLRELRGWQRSSSDEFTWGLVDVHGSTDVRVYLASMLCMQVVHEVGHNVGRLHSRNPRSLMYADPMFPPAECVQWAQTGYRRFPWVTW